MDISQLALHRPYLLRALYKRSLDSQLVPHLVVDVVLPDVFVPMGYVRDGQIVLNTALHVVGSLELVNNEVRFNARFGSVPCSISILLATVLTIYARENGASTMFEPEAAYDRSINSLNDDGAVPESESGTVMSVIDSDKPDNHDGSPDNMPPSCGGRPAPRVMK